MRWKPANLFRGAAWPGAVFLASFLVYFFTLPTTTSFEDSAEFVTAAATWGIPHPSGYPLYVLLAGLFARLPFGTIPWRVALLSAVCASASLALAFVVVRRVISLMARRLGLLGEAVVALLLLTVGYSETWWSQAIYAKMYALHVLLLLAVIYAVVRAAEGERRKPWPELAAFVFGLACSNHLFLSLAVAPFLILGMLLADPSLARPSRRWLTACAAFVIGLLPNLYLIVRAGAAPYSMDVISSPASFVDFILRRRYGDVGLSAGNKFSLALTPLTSFIVQSGPFVGALAALGVVALLRRRDRRLIAVAACLAGFMLAAPLALALRSIDWLPEHAYIVRVYGLPTVVAIGVLAGLGVAWLKGRNFVPSGRAVRLLAAVIFAMLPLAAIFGNYEAMAAYRDPFPYEYAKQTLTRLPHDAVLVARDYTINQDSLLFNLAYLQLVERFRDDVTVVEDAIERPFLLPRLPDSYNSFNLNEKRRLILDAAMADPSLSGKPIYTTFPVECAAPGRRSVGDGVVFRLLGPDETAAPAEVVAPPLPDLRLAEGQTGLGLFTAKALYSYSASLMEKEGDKAAVGFLTEAIKLDTLPISQDYRCVIEHRTTAAIEAPSPE